VKACLQIVGWASSLPVRASCPHQRGLEALNCRLEAHATIFSRHVLKPTRCGLTDSNTCWPAANALALIGKSAIPALTNALATPDSQLKIWILNAIAPLGTNGGQAVPALINCLQDSNAVVQSLAASRLGLIHQAPEISIPALTACLSNTNSQFRSSLLRAIGLFELEAKPALPAVLALMGDSEKSVRRNAAILLTQIDPNSAKLFLSQIADLDPKVREAVAFGLEISGSGDESVPSALTRLLNDDVDAVRKQAAVALQAYDRVRAKKPASP